MKFLSKIWFFFSVLLSSQSAVSSDIRVTDFSGKSVALNKPAQRIVALAPYIVENIFSAGAGDLIAGTVTYADYPEAAKAIVRVGTVEDINIDAIRNLQPDLVIVQASRYSRDIGQQLAKSGLPVYVSDPRQLEDVAKSVRDIGVMTGRQESSELSSQKFLEKLQTLRGQYSEKMLINILYQFSDKPLKTLNHKHVASD